MFTEYRIMTNGLGTLYRVEFKTQESAPTRQERVPNPPLTGIFSIFPRANPYKWVDVPAKQEQWTVLLENYWWTPAERSHIEYALDRPGYPHWSGYYCRACEFKTCSEAKKAAEDFINEQKAKLWSPVPNNDCSFVETATGRKRR